MNTISRYSVQIRISDAIKITRNLFIRFDLRLLFCLYVKYLLLLSFVIYTFCRSWNVNVFHKSVQPINYLRVLRIRFVSICLRQYSHWIQVKLHAGFYSSITFILQCSFLSITTHTNLEDYCLATSLNIVTFSILIIMYTCNFLVWWRILNKNQSILSFQFPTIC